MNIELSLRIDCTICVLLRSAKLHNAYLVLVTAPALRSVGSLKRVTSSLINFNPSINVSFRQREANHSREITRPLEELTLTMWKLLYIITDHSAVSGERDQKEDQQQFDDHRQPHLRSWFCKARHDEHISSVLDVFAVDASNRPTCMNLLSDLAQICAKFTSMRQSEAGYDGCLVIEPALLGTPQATYHMGCFNFNQVVRQIEASAAIETTEATETTEDEDDSLNTEEFIAAVSASAEQGIALFSQWLGLNLNPKLNLTSSRNGQDASGQRSTPSTTSRSARLLWDQEEKNDERFKQLLSAQDNVLKGSATIGQSNGAETTFVYSKPPELFSSEKSSDERMAQDRMKITSQSTMSRAPKIMARSLEHQHEAAKDYSTSQKAQNRHDSAQNNYISTVWQYHTYLVISKPLHHEYVLLFKTQIGQQTQSSRRRFHLSLWIPPHQVESDGVVPIHGIPLAKNRITVTHDQHFSIK
ncbi:hypothetical protein WN51_13722 [Melipona quadrifasciata]|uniref:DUF4773 domain-containing protein n=1 Tax=Melipona quadrifasciata TaxID=166423 RepID=A0A0N0U4W4_9HYME|nr:hypothetical protein WN51_13722 [Melipona quadrifasciata]